jgi:hypothetical protein
MVNIQQAAEMVLRLIKAAAPFRSGNLRYNAVRKEPGTTDDEMRIIADENIAPYMKYTNEDWSNFRLPLQGKKNPNQGWWDNAVEDAVNVVAQALGCEVRKKQTEGKQ